jgi:hypothetical protein
MSEADAAPRVATTDVLSALDRLVETDEYDDPRGGIRWREDYELVRSAVLAAGDGALTPIEAYWVLDWGDSAPSHINEPEELTATAKLRNIARSVLDDQ